MYIHFCIKISLICGFIIANKISPIAIWQLKVIFGFFMLDFFKNQPYKVNETTEGFKVNLVCQN